MAALSVTNPTLADFAKVLDPDGRVAKVIELLGQTNDILEDCVFMEANDKTSHTVTSQTSLPDPTWRQFNQGVAPTKGTTAQHKESIGMLEAYSQIDVDLAMLNGNTNQFRLSQDKPHIEAINQTQASTMFYGNSGLNPERFTGLAARYSSLTGDQSQNILSAGGAGSDNTSIYLVVWGDNTVFCPFPKGSQAGLKFEDLGVQIIQNSDGSKYKAFMSHYQWKNGLAVADWRYVVRICNVDVSDLVNQTGSQAAAAATNIIRMMARALDRIPNLNNGRAAFYCNRTVFSGLRLAAMDRTSNVLSIEKGLGQFGTSKRWLNFEEVPIRKCDALLNTEAVVS